MKNYRKLLLLLIVIVFFSCSEDHQTLQDSSTISNDSSSIDNIPRRYYSLSKETDAILDSIEKGNQVESSHIGEGGEPSIQWARYNQLKKVATIYELINLTDHENATVRCYAFQALASNRYDKIFEVLVNHLRDTAKVETLSGCIGMTQYVGDYFIDVVTPGYIETDIYKLNTKERETLDSILLVDSSIVLDEKLLVISNPKILSKYGKKLEKKSLKQ